MSEQQVKDFAEAAELRVPVPELADLTSRGRDLRRLRRIAAAGALALVLVTGGVLSSVSRDDRIERPAEDPRPDVARELDARPVGLDPDLQPGQRYAVRPWTLDGRNLRATFEVTGTGWVWRGDGMTKPLRAGSDLMALPRKPYAEVNIVRADRVINGQCKPVIPPWTDLEQVPRVAARQIGGIRGVRLEGAPTSSELSGYPAVHVQLSVPRLCAEVNDIVLWSLDPAEYGGSNGVGTVLYPGQRLEVWLVDVEGTMLIVSAELSPGLPKRFRDETDAFVESIELEPVED